MKFYVFFIEALAALLAKLGFRPAYICLALSRLLWLSLFIFLAGLLVFGWTDWLLWIGAGALLSAWNFLGPAWLVSRLFADPYEAPPSGRMIWRQVLGANLRLFISGLLVYLFLVRFNANIFAVAIGLAYSLIAGPILILRGEKADKGPQAN